MSVRKGAAGVAEETGGLVKGFASLVLSTVIVK